MIDDQTRLVKYTNAYGQTYAFVSEGLESMDEKGWYGIYRFDYMNMIAILNVLEIEFTVHEGPLGGRPVFKNIDGDNEKVLHPNDDGTYTFGSFFDEWMEIEEKDLEYAPALRAISESLDAGYRAGFFSPFAGDIRAARESFLLKKIGSLATFNGWW